MQVDPIGYKDDLDLYTYVGDDPVNRTDPTGNEATEKFLEQLRSAQAATNAATGAGWPNADRALEKAEQKEMADAKLPTQPAGEALVTVVSAVIGSKAGATPRSPSGPALPDKYWIEKKAPTQVTPGTRTTNDPAKPSSAGGAYSSTTHYDEFGRQIGQTHNTDHGRPDNHPTPHHHRRDPRNGERLKNASGSHVWPGWFGTGR
mgnify:CR=1 FL=1